MLEDGSGSMQGGAGISGDGGVDTDRLCGRRLPDKVVASVCNPGCSFPDSCNG